MNAVQRAAQRGYVFKRTNDTVALIKLRKIRREVDHETRERHPEGQAPAPMGGARRLAAYDARSGDERLTPRQWRRIGKKVRKAEGS